MGLFGSSRRARAQPSDATGQPLNQQCLNALQIAGQDAEGVARMNALMPTLVRAAGAHSTDPRLLAAIGVRESGGRNIAERGGGAGMGIFQLTHQPGVTAAQAYDTDFAANYAARMLQANRRILARRFPNFTPAQLTQATAAAYNRGAGRIRSDPASIDAHTAHNNYGSNVVDLMRCFP